MAAPVDPYMETLRFRMESYKIADSFPKLQRFFDCADSIEPLRCFQCTDFETHKLVDLKRHFNAGHIPQENFYACERCDFKTHSNFLYSRHKEGNSCPTHRKVESEAETQKFRLEDDFSYEVPILNNRVKMEYTSYQMQLLPCEYCPYIARWKHNLKHHVLAKHTDLGKIQWFECKHCPFKNKIEVYLKQHMRNMHGNQEKLKCDHCAYETKNKHILRRHITIRHTDPEKTPWFTCEQCSYRSKIKSNVNKHTLQVHIWSKHADPDKFKRYKCEHCSHKSKWKHALKHHMEAKHGTDKHLKCDQCQFATKFKKSLRVHVLRKHTSPDSIEWLHCTDCPYKSELKSNLKQHMKNMHENASRFKCHHCQLELKSKQGLQKHIIRKHSDSS